MSKILENDDEVKPTFKSIVDEFYSNKENEEARTIVKKC